jgi:uncharacterized protein
LKYIKVTLDGPEKIHNKYRIFKYGKGTYKLIIKSIKLLLKEFSELKIHINLLLNKKNINYISELFNDLERESILGNKNIKIDFGRIQFRLNPLKSNYKDQLDMFEYYPKLLDLQKQDKRITDDLLIGSELKFIGDLYRFWKNNEIVFPNMKGCNAVYPGRYCFFPDGKIYPCTEIAGYENMHIAEYFPKFLINSKIFEWKNYNVINLAKCKNCKYIAICNGGCPVSNIGVYSNMKNVYCLNIKKGIDNFISKLLKENFFNL